MRKCVATVSMSGTLRQKLEAIAAARFDGIELFESDFINFNGSARELGTMAGDLGLGIDLYQPFRDFEGMPDDAFRRSLDRAERKFDVMEALGSPLMLVCSNTSPSAAGDPQRSADQLHALAERAAKRNLRVGYEALAWGRFVTLWNQAWSIVQRADHPHLGLILDSFHTLSLRDDPAGIASLPGDRIFFLQMADAPLLAMDVLQWARHHRNFPGQGELDCENFFLQVLLSGYTGPLSLEIFNDQFRETPNRRTAVDAMRSLLYLESRARQRLETLSEPDHAAAVRDGAARALAGIDLFAPPAPARLDGYAFLEFGVAGEDAQALGALFGQLGFSRAGTHRNKQVELYRQGDIQLILNAESGSPARNRFDMQGPVVGAIGLATPDPQRAASRAAALLSARHESPRGPNQQHLPAVVAPGGTIVHFVPSGTGGAVDADFVADAAVPPSAPDCGLQAVDHVALGLAPDQFDTWVLFSRAVLGLERGESLELADPFGLIHTSGMADAARRLRLVLNVSLSQRTRSALQVHATGHAGGGVQHIAFATRDIFGTMRRLRANGVRFVPISPNYYDDLLARLDLNEERVRQMQALDILYDRSGGGEYFHAYAEPFADRFFFEIVQRDGYDGYGAVNAPARMASQEQHAVRPLAPVPHP
ncbi:MAG: sugar phosphate isomerase/epimerase and 4-hydroxyphenylpyruvate protein [Ramlibacter sp.]|nr:sugar phosphate isomerase/epimerase and 4-hydroxyphenylpyruvate protein [Ramlibacter sp.]